MTTRKAHFGESSPYRITFSCLLPTSESFCRSFFIPVLPYSRGFSSLRRCMFTYKTHTPGSHFPFLFYFSLFYYCLIHILLPQPFNCLSSLSSVRAGDLFCSPLCPQTQHSAGNVVDAQWAFRVNDVKVRGCGHLAPGFNINTISWVLFYRVILYYRLN